MKTAMFLAGLMAMPVPFVSAPAIGDEAKDAPALKRLTRDGGSLQHLSWSPDGKRLLCTRIHQGKMGLWFIDAESGEMKPVMPWTTPHFDGHWSPDGKQIAFVWDRLEGTDGKLQINTVNVDGTENKTLVPHKAF